MADSGDEQTQPEASSEQAGNDDAQSDENSETSQPDEGSDWMETESIRSGGESRESFLERFRDPGKNDRTR